jgi:nitroimidazol reductase NimA-like FMN-containing flavoprotein (pyridoxamine 5'-phosphate oxidase superfamily)
VRKKEREIADRDGIDAILSGSAICRIAFAVDGEPYLVPLSYGYDAEEGVLFFHTAAEGRKIECIEANPRVCFEVEGPVIVKAGGERACSWGLFYRSVVGYGTIRELSRPDDKKGALRLIMRQQAGRDGAWTFVSEILAATRVWALEIESVTGRQSG